MLWAGADPYCKGSDIPGEETDEDEDLSALEFAALYENYDVFMLKQIKLDPSHPIAKQLLWAACTNDRADLFKELIDRGYDPKSFEDTGSSLIQSCLKRLPWAHSPFNHREYGIDTSDAREKMKMIHLLARHGAKWLPAEKADFNEARRSLLRMEPDYTLEFIWIMAKYESCSRDSIEMLIKTPKMKALLSGDRHRVDELLLKFEYPNNDPVAIV
jgi:hypothetical protein